MDNTKSEQLVRMLLGNIGENVSRDGTKAYRYKQNQILLDLQEVHLF